MQVGTNSEYAAYVHEGTGKYAVCGGGTPEKRWTYRDELTGETRIGVPQKPRRFLRNTIKKNIDEYKKIIKEYLKE